MDGSNPPESLADCRILLVEDTPALARTYRGFLRGEEFAVDHVETGAAAKEALPSPGRRFRDVPRRPRIASAAKSARRRTPAASTSMPRTANAYRGPVQRRTAATRPGSRVDAPSFPVNPARTRERGAVSPRRGEKPCGERVLNARLTHSIARSERFR